MYQCINSGLHNQGTPPGQNVIIREESYWFCYEYRVKKSGSLTNVAQDSMQISKIWWVVLTTSCTRQPVEIFISKTFAILTNIKKYLIVGIIIVISQFIRLTLILKKNWWKWMTPINLSRYSSISQKCALKYYINFQFKVCAVYVAHLDLRRAVPQDRSVFNIQKYM